jgi:nicotinate-nucleotide adenylyltransferase
MICTTKNLEDLLRSTLSEQRLAHSRRVAQLVAKLCPDYGIDAEKGRIAGLAHDLAREMDHRQIKELAARDAGSISDLEAARPVLLHGRAAAVTLRDRFGIEDPQILEAVACHVCGCPSMGVLARIVFVADFLEPGRGFLEENHRRRLLKMDLDTMLSCVLEEIFTYLRLQGRPIAQPAIDLLEELHRQ